MELVGVHRPKSGAGCRVAGPKSAEFLLHVLKTAESNVELEGLDVDSLVIEHILVNKPPRYVPGLTELMVGSTLHEFSLPHWDDPYFRLFLNQKKRWHRRKIYPRRNWSNKNLWPRNKCHKKQMRIKVKKKRQRHYFANKGPFSQSYGFSSCYIWMWELDQKEGWTSNNQCFELQCWRRLLRVSWTTRRSNQSILKEISPEY